MTLNFISEHYITPIKNFFYYRKNNVNILVKLHHIFVKYFTYCQFAKVIVIEKCR